MRIQKCDRCGTVYEPVQKSEFSMLIHAIEDLCHHNPAEDISLEILDNDHFLGKRSLDLCPECRASFEEWFLAGKEDEA